MSPTLQTCAETGGMLSWLSWGELQHTTGSWLRDLSDLPAQGLCDSANWLLRNHSW